MGRFKISFGGHLSTQSGLPLKGVNMFTLTLVLVAIFVAVAAAATYVNKNNNSNLNIFEVGGSSYYQTSWEDAKSITALLDNRTVTLKGYSIGTDVNENFLWVADNGVCYTLYGHHLVSERVWN